MTIGQPSLTRIAMSKWDGAEHWAFDSAPGGEDRFGHWYRTPVGTTFTRPAASFVSEALHVVLIPRPGLLGLAGSTAGWVATFYSERSPIHTYVDITTPSLVTSDLVTCVDLDLDVVRDRADDRVWVDDEDEFADHQVTLRYPAELVSDAEAMCARVLRAVTGREPPFDGTAARWLTGPDDVTPPG